MLWVKIATLLGSVRTNPIYEITQSLRIGVGSLVHKTDYNRFSSIETRLRFLVAVDCEQSLFFFRFSEGSARAREKRGRQPEKKKKKETARTARANEICVSLTTQNTIG